MQLTVSKGVVWESEAEIVVYPVFAGEGAVAAVTKDLPTVLQERFRKAAKAQEFTGAAGTTVLLPVAPGMGVEWCAVVGLGERAGDSAEGARRAAGAVVQVARQHAVRTIAFGLVKKELCKPSIVQALAEGAMLAQYTFTAYKKPKHPTEVADIEFVLTEGKMVVPTRRALEQTKAIMSGVTIARDLVNMSPHEVTPTRLAMAAQEIAKAGGKSVNVKILSRAECEKLGMGCYLAVAKGSEEEPKFIHLTYTPAKPSKESIALVGKGVTFDSGGLSLKPSNAMATMKCDMAGAAAVLGLFATLPHLKPKATIHGLIPATENMPSGKATRPGDVVRAMNGQTVEIIDTDAEGRLTLIDAITYAQRKAGATEIIDLATLTGACMVALGEEIAGLMANNGQMRKGVLAAAKDSGEKVWELPLERSYAPQVQSEVADIRNLGTTRYGGAITAALFVEQAVEPETRWAHLDIAGPAFAERPFTTYLSKGGTGFGVRLLAYYLLNR
jgi:leucyl aminopeptidase